MKFGILTNSFNMNFKQHGKISITPTHTVHKPCYIYILVKLDPSILCLISSCGIEHCIKYQYF